MRVLLTMLVFTLLSFPGRVAEAAPKKKCTQLKTKTLCQKRAKDKAKPCHWEAKKKKCLDKKMKNKGKAKAQKKPVKKMQKPAAQKKMMPPKKKAPPPPTIEDMDDELPPEDMDGADLEEDY
jgi:hypothetical protein